MWNWNKPISPAFSYLLSEEKERSSLSRSWLRNLRQCEPVCAFWSLFILISGRRFPVRELARVCVFVCACWAPSKNQVIRRAKLLVLVGYWCCVVGEGDTSPCGGKILDSRFSVLDSPFSTPICSSPRVLKIAIKPRTLVRTCDCVSVLFARVCVLVLQWNGKLWIKCKRK